MREDLEEYRRAVDEFHKALRKLNTYKKTRTHSYFSIYDECFIKIYEEENGQPGKRLVSVSDEEDIATYMMATREINQLIKREEEKREKSNIDSGSRAVDLGNPVYMQHIPEREKATV